MIESNNTPTINGAINMRLPNASPASTIVHTSRRFAAQAAAQQIQARQRPIGSCVIYLGERRQQRRHIRRHPHDAGLRFRIQEMVSAVGERRPLRGNKATGRAAVFDVGDT